MKSILYLISSMLFFGSCGNLNKTNIGNKEPVESFYNFSADDIEGNSISMSNFKDKKILIVNVASKCGYTYQYKELQELYEKYKDELYILAFPSNDFLGQEPGTNEEIKNFCEVNFGVQFDIFEKISVTGNSKHSIYEWLTNKDMNGWNSQEPSWNFTKYLINENGVLIGVWGSKIEPSSDEILKKINYTKWR